MQPKHMDTLYLGQTPRKQINQASNQLITLSKKSNKFSLKFCDDVWFTKPIGIAGHCPLPVTHLIWNSWRLGSWF
jgi:hypothetical protein